MIMRLHVSKKGPWDIKPELISPVSSSFTAFTINFVPLSFSGFHGALLREWTWKLLTMGIWQQFMGYVTNKSQAKEVVCGPHCVPGV